jgi:hypothetical protein
MRHERLIYNTRVEDRKLTSLVLGRSCPLLSLTYLGKALADGIPTHFLGSSIYFKTCFTPSVPKAVVSSSRDYNLHVTVN